MIHGLVALHSTLRTDTGYLLRKRHLINMLGITVKPADRE